MCTYVCLSCCSIYLVWTYYSYICKLNILYDSVIKVNIVPLPVEVPGDIQNLLLSWKAPGGGAKQLLGGVKEACLGPRDVGLLERRQRLDQGSLIGRTEMDKNGK